MPNSIPCYSWDKLRLYKMILLLPCLFSSILMEVKPVRALPPPADIPEEVLRTEIITKASSPIDGKLLTAAEYAQLQAQLETSIFAPQINPKTRQLIFLIRLRKLIRTVAPFYP